MKNRKTRKNTKTILVGYVYITGMIVGAFGFDVMTSNTSGANMDQAQFDGTKNIEMSAQEHAYFHGDENYLKPQLVSQSDPYFKAPENMYDQLKSKDKHDI